MRARRGIFALCGAQLSLAHCAARDVSRGSGAGWHQAKWRQHQRKSQHQ